VQERSADSCGRGGVASRTYMYCTYGGGAAQTGGSNAARKVLSMYMGRWRHEKTVHVYGQVFVHRSLTVGGRGSAVTEDSADPRPRLRMLLGAEKVPFSEDPQRHPKSNQNFCTKHTRAVARCGVDPVFGRLILWRAERRVDLSPKMGHTTIGAWSEAVGASQYAATTT
jgi:hypothetical protein